MDFVVAIFKIVSVTFFLAGVVGLIAPRLFKDKKTGEIPSRKKVFFSGWGLSLLAALPVYFLAPEEMKSETVKSPTTEISAQPSTETPEKSDLPQAPTSVTEPAVEEPIKAVKPESMFHNIPFTKNAAGVVIFNSAKDLYNGLREEDEVKIYSEKPLKLRYSADVLKTDSDEINIRENELVFVRNIYRIFANTNINSVTIDALPRDTKSGKLLPSKFNIKATVTREFALKVLQTFSKAKSFDELISNDINDQYSTLGFSQSKLFTEFNSDKFRPQIVKALTTGKIIAPTEAVLLPLNLSMDFLYEKAQSVLPQSTLESRTLNNGQSAYMLKLGKVVIIEGVGKATDDLESLSLLFGFVNDPDVIAESLAGVSLASFATPNPDKTFSEVSKMIEQAGKQLKKKDTIKMSKVIDGITVELSVLKNLGGLSTLSFKKIEHKPIVFE